MNTSHRPPGIDFELNTGHNLHYTAPRETVSLLLELARAAVPAAR